MKRTSKYAATAEEFRTEIGPYVIDDFRNVMKNLPVERMYNNAQKDVLMKDVLRIIERPSDSDNVNVLIRLAQVFYPALDNNTVRQRVPKSLEFLRSRVLIESVLRLYSVLDTRADDFNENKFEYRVPDDTGSVYVASILVYYTLGLNTLVKDYLTNLIALQTKDLNLPIPITSENTMRNTRLFLYQPTYSIETTDINNPSDVVKAMAYAVIYNESVFMNIRYGNKMTFEWAKQKETGIHVEPVVQAPTVPTPVATQPAQPVTPSASQSGIVSQRNLLQTQPMETVTWSPDDFEFSQNTQSGAKTTLVPPVYSIPSQSQRTQRSQPRTGAPGGDERTLQEKRQEEIKLVREENRSHFMSNKREVMVDKDMDLVETAVLTKQADNNFKDRHRREEERIAMILRDMQKEIRPRERPQRIQVTQLERARHDKENERFRQIYLRQINKEMDIEN